MAITTIKKSSLKLDETDRVFKVIKPQGGFILTDARYPAYVGGWGTGKTTAGIGRAMRLSEMYPGNLGLIGRKEYTDLKDSTVKDFESYTGFTVNSGREVVLPNGSIIMFRHLEELNNIQNINLGWFWIEQAEEFDTDESFFKLFGRLRRKGYPGSGFITANACGHNWIYKLWKAGGLVQAVKKLMDEDPALFGEIKDPGEVVKLFEATTFDNAHNLSKQFMASLQIIKEKKPKLYNRFVLNSWEDSDTVDIIIQPAWIDAAIKRQLNTVPPIRRVVSIDVARYGDDKTVFYAIENGEVIGREEWEKKSTMETVGLAIRFAKKCGGIESFAVDEIGVGGGVADRLQELDKDVVFVNAAAKSSKPEEYYNLRAEIYSQGADKFQDGKVKLRAENTDLTEQLSWARYKTIKSNGIYQVEAKEDIKKRYGRSPDDADCFLNGLWALDKIDPSKSIKRDKYAMNRRVSEAPLVI